MVHVPNFTIVIAFFNVHLGVNTVGIALELILTPCINHCLMHVRNPCGYLPRRPTYCHFPDFFIVYHVVSTTSIVNAPTV